MNDVIIISDVDDFLDKAVAYDIISSAVGIMNNKLALIYQNDAFKNLSISRNRALLLSGKDNVILANNNVLDLIKESIESKKSLSKKIDLPFNSNIFLEITLQLTPILTQDKVVQFVMLTLEEESVDLTFLNKIRTQQKFTKLTEQIVKLTDANQNKRELIKTLLFKTPFPVLIVDENQQILQSNDAAKKLFSNKTKNIIGQHCTKYFECYQKTGSCSIINNYDSTFEEQVHSSIESGVDTTFLRHSSAIKFNNRPAVLEAFVDIGEKVKFEHDLIQSKAYSDLANLTKSEFLTNMSHELRTPLHAILSFSRFGINKINSPQENLLAYFEKIQVSGNTLLRLLNDLLDLSKLESGKTNFSFSMSSLDESVLSVLDEFTELTIEKNINVVNDLNGIQVVFDEDKIKQVIRNIIGNAIKFSPNGGRILISTYTKDDDIYFSIDDNGPGVPVDELEQVFDKFIQSSKINTGLGGTGLGLSICKEIIAKHNGTIWAENSSQGGRFLFTLPIFQD